MVIDAFWAPRGIADRDAVKSRYGFKGRGSPLTWDEEGANWSGFLFLNPLRIGNISLLVKCSIREISELLTTATAWHNTFFNSKSLLVGRRGWWKNLCDWLDTGWRGIKLYLIRIARD